MPEIPLMERAFAIARSGQARNFRDIDQQLIREGYSRTSLVGIGPATRSQLAVLCREAQQALSLTSCG